MINWNKYVDKIVCIHNAQNKTRKTLFKNELKRVGMLKLPIFYQETITPNNNLKQNYKNLIKDIQDKDYKLDTISKVVEQISIIKKAYYEGCNKILIFEDNIRFLKDLNKIEQILQNIPSDNLWDMISFNTSSNNYIQYFNIIKDKKNLINNYYCKFYRFNLSSCYILNREVMKKLICLYQLHDFTTIENKLTNFILYNDWKRIFSLTNLAVDAVFFDKENTLTDNQKLNIAFNEQKKYKNIELDFNNYMMTKNGEPFYYGGYIEE